VVKTLLFIVNNVNLKKIHKSCSFLTIQSKTKTVLEKPTKQNQT